MCLRITWVHTCPRCHNSFTTVTRECELPILSQARGDCRRNAERMTLRGDKIRTCRDCDRQAQVEADARMDDITARLRVLGIELTGAARGAGSSRDSPTRTGGFDMGGFPVDMSGAEKKYGEGYGDTDQYEVEDAEQELEELPGSEELVGLEFLDDGLDMFPKQDEDRKGMDDDVDMFGGGYTCICHEQGRDTRGLPCKCRS